MNNTPIKPQPLKSQPSANGSVEPSLHQLQDKKTEVKSAINRVLHYLLPEQDRRSTNRRLDLEQRHADSEQPYNNERRLAPRKRLFNLRKELHKLLQSEEKLKKWQERQLH